MSGFQPQELRRRLGVSGLIFAVAFPLFVLFFALGHSGPALVCALLLIPVTFWLFVRAFKFVKRHSLWSLRNRLLLVYGLLGVLPVLLFVTLVGLGAWALMSELASYLAGSALDRRVAGVADAVQVLRAYPSDIRAAYVPEVFKPFRTGTPGFIFMFRDAQGEHYYPPDATHFRIDPAWKNVHGLLVVGTHFYAWSHYSEAGQEIAAFAPLNNETVKNLVPHLGDIGLVEIPDKDDKRKTFASAGSGAITSSSASKDPDFHWSMNEDGGTKDAPRVSNLPPAAFRFDIPVFIPATRTHYRLDSPNKTYSAVLWVYSRPSAVMGSFFSGYEIFRNYLFDALVAVAILFLVVELVAICIGVSLSRRITGAVHHLYEGTRRVIHGDFRHRIPVTDSDQLGELTQSFNQMTGNLERLLSVEKEKERLQTELEIAREVQGQLYPKAAPPTSCGLRLTVRNDPARMVSGDYYDYQDVGTGKVVFAIGDVAGKGISAALLMATLQAALRAQITNYSPPVHTNDCTERPQVDVARLVSRLNKQIYAHTSPEKYATFFFALFDEQTHTLTYTNAGHLSPLLFRKKEVVPLDSNGTVVGAFPFARYDESCLSLLPGDLLVCYTDGITEPENAYGEMFGEERMIDLIQRYADREDGEILDVILEAVKAWTGSPELHDDMTLLLARHIQPA